MFALICIRCLVAGMVCCWPSTRTTSVRPCALVTDSIWHGCCLDADRTIVYHAEVVLRTIVNALLRRGISSWRRPKRRSLDESVVEFAGEILLARSAQPEDGPGLLLHVAAASAATGLFISAATLSRLATSAAEMPTS